LHFEKKIESIGIGFQ